MSHGHEGGSYAASLLGRSQTAKLPASDTSRAQASEVHAQDGRGYMRDVLA